MNIRFLLSISLIAIMLGCTGTTPPASSEASSSESKSEEATNMPAETASTSAEETPKEYVIDVRSQEEWDAGHLDQAIRITHTEITEKIADVTEDKSAKIILHCQKGGRAGRAKEALEEMGYTNVENGGGIEDMRKRYDQ